MCFNSLFPSSGVGQIMVTAPGGHRKAHEGHSAWPGPRSTYCSAPGHRHPHLTPCPSPSNSLYPTPHAPTGPNPWGTIWEKAAVPCAGY